MIKIQIPIKKVENVRKNEMIIYVINVFPPSGHLKGKYISTYEIINDYNFVDILHKLLYVISSIVYESITSNWGHLGYFVPIVQYTFL